MATRFQIEKTYYTEEFGGEPLRDTVPILFQTAEEAIADYYSRAQHDPWFSEGFGVSFALSEIEADGPFAGLEVSYRPLVSA